MKGFSPSTIKEVVNMCALLKSIKTALFAFQCVNRYEGMACECNINVPQSIKDKFYKKYGFEYDEFCHYDLSSYYFPTDTLDRSWMYEQQGATEPETAKEIWPYAEVIDPDISPAEVIDPDISPAETGEVII